MKYQATLENYKILTVLIQENSAYFQSLMQQIDPALSLSMTPYPILALS